MLDYHHKNPLEKEFTIGRASTRSQEALQEEISKCIILCANCHREFHHLNKSKELSLEEYLLI